MLLGRVTAGETRLNMLFWDQSLELDLVLRAECSMFIDAMVDACKSLCDERAESH